MELKAQGGKRQICHRLVEGAEECRKEKARYMTVHQVGWAHPERDTPTAREQASPSLSLNATTEPQPSGGRTGGKEL